MKVAPHDGCSGGMSTAWRWLYQIGILGPPVPPWEGCCDIHDYFYAIGGTRRQREFVDADLRRCVLANGHPVWAWVMYAAIRLFGAPWWPVPWRWGFECPYVCGYDGE
jgi:hypothetical protein